MNQRLGLNDNEKVVSQKTDTDTSLDNPASDRYKKQGLLGITEANLFKGEAMHITYNFDHYLNREQKIAEEIESKKDYSKTL